MVTGCNARTISAAVGAVAVAVSLNAGAAAAQTTSVVSTGAYLHFPKIVAHTTSPDASPALAAGEYAKDTVIQLTNTTNEVVEVNCYYINANRHCGGPPGSGPVCRADSECPAGIRCVPGWQSADFSFNLTPLQPLGWTASQGLAQLPCFNFGEGCPQDQTGIIPAVSEEPFIGELRCIVVEDDVPVADNVLKGEATIVEAGPSGAIVEVLAAAYNAISFQGISDDEGGEALCLGGAPGDATCAASYSPCAANLSLQHFFDGAETPEGVVSTELTLSPCSTRLEAGDLIVPENRVVALMLVYNEFEQRFSTATVVDCLENLRLVDIDTPLGPQGDAFSLFAVGTQGTLGGQTRIKGQTSDTDFGPGLVGVAHQYFSEQLGSAPLSSSAYHVNGNFAADPAPDAVYPPAPPVGP
jgi:hypothetical protein